MKTPMRQTDHAEAGFTLIELLAVMAIISVVVAAFTFGGARGLETAKLRAVIARTAAAITDARARAIRSNEKQFFALDSLASQLPPGAGLSAAPDGARRAGEGASGIWLYPDGTTSGGGLAFAWQGRTYEIRVNWLTGNVSQHQL